jgi:hypothetical protein
VKRRLAAPRATLRAPLGPCDPAAHEPAPRAMRLLARALRGVQEYSDGGRICWGRAQCRAHAHSHERAQHNHKHKQKQEAKCIINTKTASATQLPPRARDISLARPLWHLGGRAGNDLEYRLLVS